MENADERASLHSAVSAELSRTSPMNRQNKNDTVVVLPAMPPKHSACRLCLYSLSRSRQQTTRPRNSVQPGDNIRQTRIDRAPDKSMDNFKDLLDEKQADPECVR